MLNQSAANACQQRSWFRCVISPRLRALCYALLTFALPTMTTQAAEEFTGNDTGLNARALLVATQRTILSSQIGGKISALTAQEGDWFQQGDRLIQLDCAIQKAQKLKAEAELKKTYHQLEVQQQLDKLDSGSQLELKLAAVNVERAEAELNIVDIRLQHCTIYAPFKGQIVERSVNAYQNIASGQPLLEIIDNTSLEIKLIVPSLWLAWLKTGLRFDLKLDETEQHYAASIKRIGANIDPASQSVTLFGKFQDGAFQDSPAQLISGMSGTASFDPPASAE